MRGNGYPVVWQEDGLDGTTAGVLSIRDGHAILAGSRGGTARVATFDAEDVRGVEIVSCLGRRLNNRPTVDVTLADGHHIRIGEFAGFGIAADIVEDLESWSHDEPAA